MNFRVPVSAYEVRSGDCHAQYLMIMHEFCVNKLHRSAVSRQHHPRQAIRIAANKTLLQPKSSSDSSRKH
jgi:hypothetical protein